MALLLSLNPALVDFPRGVLYDLTFLLCVRAGLSFLLTNDFACCRNVESTNALIRFVVLGLLLVISVGVVMWSGLAPKTEFSAAIFSNSAPCLVVMVLTIIPDACHQERKVLVKVLTIVVLTIIALCWLLASGDVGFPLTLLVGTVYTALQWSVSAFLCTDECRKSLIRCLSKTLGAERMRRLCSCLEEDDWSAAERQELLPSAPHSL